MPVDRAPVDRSPADRALVDRSLVDRAPLRVDVLGVVSVRGEHGALSGHALGGRRARLVLVALAVASGPVPAGRLAQIVWGEALPPTWPVALRGVVRGLRAVCAPLGGGGQELIATVPAGYRLSPNVRVDVLRASDDVARAGALFAEGRYNAVIDLTGPVAEMTGDQLLPGEDRDWLMSNRRVVDTTALRAVALFCAACGQIGDHHRAIEAARRALDSHPIEESLHRALIAALARSGDRAGAAQAYENCRAVLASQLGVDPSAETVEVFLAALRDQAPGALAPIPVATDSFIGREREVAELASAVDRTGLVTITGRGGVGKSRVAAVVAARATVDGGRLWLPLAPVSENALVATTVAVELGVASGSDDPADAIATRLAPLGRVLLVLDGCEHVADGVASLVATVLARAPALTVLATSRVPLDIDGETVVSLDPWPAPDPLGRLEDNGQVRLLADRVREAGGRLQLDAGAAPHLITLCRRCGGLPLALELAAAHLAAMPAGDLVDHLESVGPVGEDSLRSIARSSYLQLDDDEAAVFRCLAILDGPVGLPLIRQVVAYGPVTPIRVVRILRELTAHSLLNVDRTGSHWRYQQDDDLHRFAGELLVHHGEERAAYDRLADAIRARLPDDARAAPGPFREEISAILGSVRSLFAAGLSGRADRDRCHELAFRLHRYFAATSLHEGLFWLDRLRTASPGGPWSAYATYAIGYLSYWAGDTERAMRELKAAADVMDGERDPYRVRALIFLAGLLDDTDQGALAVQYVGMSIEAAAVHDIDLQCSAAMGMGSVLAERGSPAAAGYAHDAIALCRRGGSAEQLAIAMPTAAMICWQVGDLDAARDYIAEALPLNAGPARIARVVLLSAAAAVAFADGDFTGTLEHGTTAFREAAELGVEREVPFIRAVLARAALAQGDAAGAARHAAGALDTALGMSIDCPLAVGLETAALVLHGFGPGQLAAGATIADLLTAAAVIRQRGDRPVPPALTVAIDALRTELVSAERVSAELVSAERVSAEPAGSLSPRHLAGHARDALARVAGTSPRRASVRAEAGPGPGHGQ